MRRLGVALFLALGCGSEGSPTTPGADAAPGAGADLGADMGTSLVFDAGLTDGGCVVEEAAPALEGGMHVGACTPVTHGSKPPSSGQHYPSWPMFRVYSRPVPWGFLVHGLEHGAVVIAYNCPGGCPTEVAAIEEVVAAVPVRPGCARPPVIVTPDPTLDVPFAASAWGHTLRAGCFDRARFAAFIQSYVNQGPENIPGDCGAIDCEATDWCAAPQLCPRR